MVKMLCIQVLALLCAIFVVEGVPTFSDVYHTSGILRLPYAELNEPFEVFYNKSAAASRMDFYGGMDKTYLLATKGTYGTSFIISPMTDKSGTSAAECFLVNGTKDGPIAIQSILPDVSQFKSIGKIIVRGIITDGWQLVVTNGNKKNTYTMAVLDNKPVQYEMMGYDSLLGSHYDKYIVDYMHYDTLPIDPKIFVIQDESKCGSFPGPGIEHHLASNPLQELVNPDKENSIHKLFDEFKNKHDKQYHGDDEHEMRKMHFTNNVRYIHSKNRAGLTYKLAVNHLADRSQNELKTMNGYRYSGVPHEGYPFHKLDMPLTDIPDAIDWNIKGAVTQVKDQAVCGSCWSFGAIGAIEGALFMKSNKLVRLSQQNLVDCSWGYGNNGCFGGEQFRSYQWVMDNGGIASEEQYGPYLGQNGLCHFNKSMVATKISNYTQVPSGDIDSLKKTIANYGPVSVSIDASHRSLSFYSNGVYYEEECGNKPENLDHAVLAVGYGTMANQSYWLVKNSWSTYWGMNGFVLMSQKDNNCGVATDATLVTI